MIKFIQLNEDLFNKIMNVEFNYMLKQNNIIVQFNY